METSSEEGSRRSRSVSPTLVMLTAATIVLGFGLMTRNNTLGVQEDSVFDVADLSSPDREPGFVAVTELPDGPWEPFRINGAYLFRSSDDLYSVITDQDRSFEVELPRLEVLFGAISTGTGSLAYGTASDGPAVWRSSDLVEWTIEPLPWDGTVRAAVGDGTSNRLIGIRSKASSFEYIVAEDSSGAWEIEPTMAVPDAALVSVPDGFVARGPATDGSAYGYLFSTDGVEWIFQAEGGVGVSRSAGLIPAFVIEGGSPALLRLAGDDREFIPPAWPISGIWTEGSTIWMQTPDAAWASTDTVTWTEYPIGPSTGVANGFTVLLPVGDVPRLATSVDNTILLMRWDTGIEPGP